MLDGCQRSVRVNVSLKKTMSHEATLDNKSIIIITNVD